MINRKTGIARFFVTIALLSGFATFLSRPAVAAPFCVEAKGVPSQCWYYDVRECKTAAAKENARCSVNPNEILASGAGGSFCIVDSAKRPECGFENWGSCEDVAAKRSGSICFENTKKQNVDPFRYDRMPLQPQ